VLLHRPRLIAAEQRLQFAGAAGGDGAVVLVADQFVIDLVLDGAEDAEGLEELGSACGSA
jgi:hypothetical protein